MMPVVKTAVILPLENANLIQTTMIFPTHLQIPTMIPQIRLMTMIPKILTILTIILTAPKILSDVITDLVRNAILENGKI